MPKLSDNLNRKGLSALLALLLAVAGLAVPSPLMGVATASSDETPGDATELLPGPCDEDYVAPTPTAVPVTAVPIVVTSTTADYFVLYVTLSRWSGSGTYEIPVSVTRGESGSTTLSDNLPPLAADKYRVEKYQVAQPADVDGDCVDDITELDDLGTYNPTNRAPKMDISDGAVAIATHEDFEALTSTNAFVRLQGEQIDVVKFWIRDLYTDNPSVYLINTARHPWHNGFITKMNIPYDNGHDGAIAWEPNVVAPDGTLGVYRYYFWAGGDESFERTETIHAILAAAMPVVREHNSLAYYQILNVPRRIAQYEAEKAKYDASRINVLLFEDLMPDVDYIAFNKAEGYGRLRLMADGDQPRPTDIAIYESLPNDLPRVAGTISTIPQTPLSHVNLRAIQNGVPNAFIRDLLKDDDLKALIGKHVYFAAADEGYTLRAATKKEVDDHHAAARPTATQTPVRDLTVQAITSLADVTFDDWDVFGVKAANMAELSKLGLPEGTVPVGYAVPFYFYDEFMKANGFYEDVNEMLADDDFQSDYDEQEKQLKALRKKIKKGTTPEWIIDALEAMHATYPEGQSLRYRSSTNNEDLPAFNGAGLYDSKTQDPDETAEDGIDKSIKAVWASLWNFRAFLEREYYRVDHLQTAMGVLVHPNFSDELANGVAVSYDPIRLSDDKYYVNTQVGEDLVTNPEANSYPEELLLDSQGTATVLARSNLAKPGELLMSEAQMVQLRNNLQTIHDRFKTLYNVQYGEDYAIEIEFKITAADKLAIKQARPWVFAPPISGGDCNGPTLFTPAEHTLPANEIHVVVLEYSRPRGKISFTFAGPDTQHFKLYGSSDLLVFEAQDFDAPADADGDGVYEFELTVTDGDSCSTKIPMRFTVSEAAPTPPEVSVTAGSGVTEGGDAQFTVTASPVPPEPLEVSVTVSQSGDFGASTGARTVTVPTSGSATVTVSTADDDADETDGSVTATVGAGEGYTVSGTQWSASVNVADNDDPPPVTPEVSVTAGSGVTEGGSASFTVSASPAPSAPLSVSVSVSQSGDFGAATGSRTVTVPTSGSATVTVATSDDTADETDGSVSVAVNARSGYTVSTTQGTATVGVSDNDEPPPVTPEVSVTAGSGVTEGGSASFTVSASPAPSAPLSVSVSVSQSGDFGAATGSRTVTVPTSGSATVTVATSDDTADETDGSVSVAVNARSGYTVSTTQGTATVGVSDNDEPPLVTPEVSVTAGSGVTEGGSASFTVSASPAPSAPLSVSVSVSQSGDFGAATGSRTVTVPTSGSATVTVATSDDTADETDGSVSVAVNARSGYTVSTTQGTATVGVSDNDEPPLVTPEVSVTAGSGVTEGGSASFTVSASPAPTSPLSVSVSVSQQGDFGASTGSRTVTVPTSGSATVTVSTSDDETDETDGSVSVAVNARSGYTVSTTQGTATVGVSDNDDPPPTDLPEVSVTDAAPVVEGEYPYFMEFSVTLSEASERDVTVSYETREGTATDHVDYRGERDGRVVIYAGRLKGMVIVQVNHGGRLDDAREETMQVVLTAADGAVIADDTATGTIIDADWVERADWPG